MSKSRDALATTRVHSSKGRDVEVRWGPAKLELDRGTPGTNHTCTRDAHIRLSWHHYSSPNGQRS